MSYGLVLYTAATTEPVTLKEAKDQWSLPRTGEHWDDRLNAFIASARQWVEIVTGRQIITATWDLQLDRFPGGTNKIYIPKSPLSSVTSITYLESSAGASTTWASTNYRVVTSKEPGEITPAFGVAYPSVYAVNGAVTIRFVAGYGAATAVPQAIKTAVLLKVKELFLIATGDVAKGYEEAALNILKGYAVGDEFHQYAECA